MALMLQFPSREEREYRATAERIFVEHLLKVRPDYRDQAGGLPELESAPAPGLASALAAAKMMRACCKFGAAG